MAWPSGEELGDSVPGRGNKCKAQRQGGLGGSGEQWGGKPPWLEHSSLGSAGQRQRSGQNPRRTPVLVT